MLRMLAVSSIIAMSSFAVANESSDVDEEMDMPMASYAVGVQSGILLNDNIKRSAEVGIALDKEKVIAGFVDGLYDKSTLTYEEALPYLQQLDTAMKEKEKAMMAKFSEENKAAGERFMEKQAELMETIRIMRRPMKVDTVVWLVLITILQMFLTEDLMRDMESITI